MIGQTVAFSYRNELPSNNIPGNNLPGRPELFAMLRRRDLSPVVTLNAEQAFQDGGIEATALFWPRRASCDTRTYPP